MKEEREEIEEEISRLSELKSRLEDKIDDLRSEHAYVEMPQGERVALVVCYRKNYTSKGLQKIKKLLEQRCADHVIILRINETRPSSKGIRDYLGVDDHEDLRGDLAEDRRARIWRYSEAIKRICERLRIPYTLILEKGDAGEIILEVIKKYDPSSVFIHQSDRNWLDRYLLGSVVEEVQEGTDVDVITID